MQQGGVTRPGRLGEHPPQGAQPMGGAAGAAGGGGDPRRVVDEALKGNRVVIFSKSICPKCRKGKEILSKYLPDKYTVLELDQRPDGEAIQDIMQEMTGVHTVPRIFIDVQCLGGADELGDMDASGQLVEQLRSKGLITA